MRRGGWRLAAAVRGGGRPAEERSADLGSKIRGAWQFEAEGEAGRGAGGGACIPTYIMLSVNRTRFPTPPPV